MKPLAYRNNPLLFHHCRSLQHCHFGVVEQCRWELVPEPACEHEKTRKECHDCGYSCQWCEWYENRFYWDAAYRYIEQKAGFHPLFMAVGDSPDVFRTTGFSSMFQAYEGEPTFIDREQDSVMFSFARKPNQGFYQSVDWWTCILNYVSHTDGEQHIPRGAERSTWKSSWSEKQWMDYAARDGKGDVQLVVPNLDLRLADSIWCTKEEDYEKLVEMGFSKRKIRYKRRMNIFYI